MDAETSIQIAGRLLCWASLPQQPWAPKVYSYPWMSFLHLQGCLHCVGAAGDEDRLWTPHRTSEDMVSIEGNTQNRHPFLSFSLTCSVILETSVTFCPKRRKLRHIRHTSRYVPQKNKKQPLLPSGVKDEFITKYRTIASSYFSEVIFDSKCKIAFMAALTRFTG